MTIVRVGTNKKYSAGWEAAFGKQPTAGKKSASRSTGKKTVAKGASKAALKPGSPKKATSKTASLKKMGGKQKK